MCADAYIQYVKTLLLEAGVLGNALKGVPDWEDESSSNIESLEKMTEDEQEDVTHEENINELVILGTYTTTSCRINILFIHRYKFTMSQLPTKGLSTFVKRLFKGTSYLGGCPPPPTPHQPISVNMEKRLVSILNI